MSTLHPHVLSLLPAVRERRDVALRDRDVAREEERITKVWPQTPLSHRASGPTSRLGSAFGLDAILAFASGDLPGFAAAFRNAVAFGNLAFRWQVFLCPHSKDNFNLPISAWDTIKAVGPALVGDWAAARHSAEALVLAAELDQGFSSPDVFARYWGKGTVDAWLIFLLSSSFAIKTSYRPAHPLAPVYADLLQDWQAKDEVLFRRRMQAGAEFHLHCSGQSGDDDRFEFETYFAQIFPLELLVI